MKRSRRTDKLATQAVEYMVSGGVYFWTGYLVFALCDAVFGLKLVYAKVIANLAGWIVNFLLQRFWVFRDPSLARHKTEVTFRYGVITVVDFVLDLGIVYGLAAAGLTPYLGQFVSAGFFTVWNYAWYRLWVFSNRTHRRHGKAARRGR